MTGDELVEDIKSEAEINRVPGWDSKVYSKLLAYCSIRHRPHLRGENSLPTDALIKQIEEWVAAEQTLQDIKALVK